MSEPVLIAVAAGVLTAALTPVAIKAANRFAILDIPDQRKIHRDAVPRGGGVAFVVAWLAAAAWIWSGPLFTGGDGRLLLGLLTGAAIIGAAGFYDDLKETSSMSKLAFETTAAALFLAIARPALALSAPMLALAFVWIIGVTNAFNLIDGLDGLAAGLAAGAAGGFVVLGLALGLPVLYICALTLAAVCAGFLPFNWHPAKVFMGDSGSLFLGFSLAALGVVAAGSAPAIGPAAVSSALFLLVPVFDTVLSIARRLVHRRPLFAPDKSHFYNLLMNRGFSHLGSVLICYGLGLSGVVAGLLVVSGPQPAAAVLAAITFVIAALSILTLRYRLLAME